MGALACKTSKHIKHLNTAGVWGWGSDFVTFEASPWTTMHWSLYPALSARINVFETSQRRKPAPYWLWAYHLSSESFRSQPWKQNPCLVPKPKAEGLKNHFNSINDIGHIPFFLLWQSVHGWGASAHTCFCSWSPKYAPLGLAPGHRSIAY